MSVILIHRRPVGGRQEDVDLVLPIVEGERVGSFVRRPGFDDSHAPRVKDVNHSWESNGDIETPQLPIEEDNVGWATEVPDQTDLSGIQVNRHQLPLVTGAEELSRTGIQIKAMGSLGGNLEGLPNSRGMVSVNPHDKWGIRDIHVECARDLVVNGPPRAPRKGQGAGHRLLARVDQRYARGVRDIGIADISHEQ